MSLRATILDREFYSFCVVSVCPVQAMMEMLVNDYSRKGFVDGRTVRYPTIIVRPGAPNRAVTGIFSSVIREPLSGLPVTVTVDPALGHACAGYDTIIRATLAIHELPREVRTQRPAWPLPHHPSRHY